MMKILLLILVTLLAKNVINASNINYTKCFETRVYCQSLPENCVQENSECHTLLIASPSTNNGVLFELFGKVDQERHWFATGLSSDSHMGDDSVTEIYMSNDEKHQEMRQSWNKGKDNELINDKVKGVTQIGDVVYRDGILSGKWIRDAVTEVKSNWFDIMNNKYYILLATGAVDPANNNKRYHSEKSVSKTQVDLQFGITNDQALKELYTICKTLNTSLCFGLPDDNCTQTENCNLILAITMSEYDLINGTASFQLIGQIDSGDSGWIAAALSEDSGMGSDSVVECLVLSNSTALLRNSWNDGKTNIVIGQVKGVVQTGSIVFQNKLLNCKWTREQITKVKDTTFDLSNKYYILLAKGPIKDQKTAGKRQHSGKIASKTPQQIIPREHPMSTTSAPSALSSAYELCNNNKRLCWGVNDDGGKCVESGDCTVLFSCIAQSEGDVDIELFWNRGFTSSDHWSAVALSTDNSMGEDVVTECILKSDGSVNLRNGWNPDGRHKDTINVEDNSTTSLATSFQNGVVYCKWHRNAFSSIKGHDFDIKNSSYHLFLAYGKLSPDEKNILKHSKTPIDSGKVNLQSVGILKETKPIWVQLHATFMIVGWLGCVGIAILLARHYKNSWPDSTLCGVKIWFAFHRSLMICGVILVLAATIIIFVNKKGWVGASAHPIVGLTSIILCFLQPIGASFRPNADHSKRWLFNWLHWSGGYIGYLLSFVAICLSTKFSTLVPKQTLGVLIAYIIVYILSHVLHHLKTILRDRHIQKDQENKKETLIDLTLALLSVVIIMAFILALVILLFI